jgi:precorrin-6B methylase 2
MTLRAAVRLLRCAAPAPGGVWIDLGAGRGTLTRALALLLGPAGRVYAIDRDADALAILRATHRTPGAAEIVTVEADFTQTFDVPGVKTSLDGLLLANALHFVRQAENVLALWAGRLRPGAQVIVIEYDQRPASRWVPYPIDAQQLPALARAADVSELRVVARQPSAFGGDLYLAVGARR